MSATDGAYEPIKGTTACTQREVRDGLVLCGCGWVDRARSGLDAKQRHHWHVRATKAGMTPSAPREDQ